MDKLGAGFDPAELEQAIPVRRWGSTLDIALGAVYLASDAGTFISGETIVIDGASWLFKPALAGRDMIRSFSKSTEKKQKKAPVGIASKL